MSILQWILPPILGAGIGYLTNAIAIRMLFRPFSEKRFLGIRVPFTPGIIPRYRYELAENIAVMVNSELMSKELLHDFLSAPHFSQELRGRVGDSVRRALDWKLGTFLGGINRLKRHAVGLPRELKGSFVDGGLDLAFRFLRFSSDKGVPARDLVPFDVSGIVSTLSPGVYDQLTESLIQVLEDPQIKELLVERARGFVDQVLHRFTVLQKFLINVGKYTVTLKQRMPEIIDDLFGALAKSFAEEEMRNRLVTAASRGIDAALDRPISPEAVDSLERFIDEAPLDLSSGPSSVRAAAAFLFSNRNRRVSEFFDLDEKRIEELTEAAAGIVQGQILFRLEPVLETINIRKLVVDRINALNIEDVERILLLIIEKHLAWINIFGAILGAFIGGLQLLLRIFLP
jgi:uncharacterized membrane protein YheB (UPF0754 family)